MVPTSAGMDRQKEFVLRTLEERDIRFVRLWFTDVLGFLKSVAIAPAELEGAFEEGIGFDGSSIEGFARVSESDTVAQPGSVDVPGAALGHQRPATTTRRGCSATSPCRTARRRGRIRGTCYAVSCRRPTTSASPATCIPRSSSSCCEPGPEDGSEPVPIDNAGYFDQAVHESASKFRRHAIEALEFMGISVEFSHHEGAPGQQEIDSNTLLLLLFDDDYVLLCRPLAPEATPTTECRRPSLARGLWRQRFGRSVATGSSTSSRLTPPWRNESR